MSVRVPDERLNEMEAALTPIRHLIAAHGTRSAQQRSFAALAALVADLRAARADNQRLRDEVARLAISSPPEDFDGTYEDWVRDELCELTEETRA